MASYALLGLVPDTLDLRAVLLSLYTEQVAGFYEPDSTALFVMDDQPASALQGLLIHELVHAVQDQTVDLHALTDPDLGNDRADGGPGRHRGPGHPGHAGVPHRADAGRSGGPGGRARLRVVAAAGPGGDAGPSSRPWPAPPR